MDRSLCRFEGVHRQDPLAVTSPLVENLDRRTLRSHLAKMRPAPGRTCAVSAGSPGSSSWAGRPLAAKGAGSEAAERGWRRRPSRREVAAREESGDGAGGAGGEEPRKR